MEQQDHQPDPAVAQELDEEQPRLDLSRVGDSIDPDRNVHRSV